MDVLLKLLTRYVESQEAIATALGEMNADGIAIVVTDARGEETKEADPEPEAEDPEPADPEPEAEETKDEDDDSLTGGDPEPEPVIELAQVRAAIRAYAAKHSEAKAIALMKKTAKAEKISEIKPEFYPAIMEAVKKK